MVSSARGKDAAKEHEAFKSRLVDDVLGQDVDEKVPMEKVVMMLWSFRDDPSVVTFMARFVQKYSGSRHVFDGIEFYLPQLAHMIIHLEVEWDDAILERLTLVIAQQSLHFALQFNWILQGALQDYHPELLDGSGAPNPNYSPQFYSRCLKLLKNVERVVVYGKPRAQELQKLYETGKITKQEMQILEQADRRFNAAQIVNQDIDDDTLHRRHVGALDGVLLVQLPILGATQNGSSSNGGGGGGGGSASSSKKSDTTAPQPPDFVQRFCVLEKHVLNVYLPSKGCGPAKKSKLDRAMSLEKAKVRIVTDGKTKDMEILVTTRTYTFRLRCTSPEECKLWARRLGEEADASALFPTHHHTTHHHHHQTTMKEDEKKLGGTITTEPTSTRTDKNNLSSSVTSTTSTATARFRQDLSPAQLDRYYFFQNERQFVDALTQVAEDLRYKDRQERKALAPVLMKDLQIPPTVYLPLCNSSDIWRRVHSTLSSETRVFNTKERCPTVMHFITRRGETVSHDNRDGNHDGTGNNNRRRNSSEMRVDPNLDVAEYMHAYLDVNLDNEHADDDNVIEEGDEQQEEESKREEQQEGGGGEQSALSDNNNKPVGSPVNQGMEVSADGKKSPVLTTEDKIAKTDDSEMVNSRHGSVSNVWAEEPGDDKGSNASQDELDNDPTSRENRVQRMIRESVVTIPARFAKKLNPRNHQQRRISIMDQQTVVQPLVPILEGSRATGATAQAGAAGDEYGENASVGDGTTVSVEKSSILVKDTVLLGDLQEGDIDIESIDRAKQYVSGGEVWAEKSARMLEDARKKESQEEEEEEGHGEEENSNVQREIASCLAKSNDDLRQEVFVMQMIHYYKSVFAQAKLPLWLKTYRILSTSSSEGLLELLTDATSLDGLKKSEGYPTEGGLRKYFEIVYGAPDSKPFKAAQRNFMTSLAGYAIVSYLLGLKDRHNGNIMIDTRGHLIFIDFGFALGMAPGHEFSFERAPFKLTKEMVEVMGGVGSDCYKEFETLFVAGFEEARKNYQIALGLVEIMMFKSNYPCFSGWRYGNGKALVGLEKRLMLNVPDKKVKRRALNLIKRSRQHFGTYLYDAFQHATNGYAM